MIIRDGGTSSSDARHLGVLAQLLDQLERQLPDGRFRSRQLYRAGETRASRRRTEEQRWKARRVTVHAGGENPSASRARFKVDWNSRVDLFEVNGPQTPA
jgi:hypothetical protein